jgi:hypothetical protein
MTELSANDEINFRCLLNIYFLVYPVSYQLFKKDPGFSYSWKILNVWSFTEVHKAPISFVALD